eukprot:6199726-Pleurochrysis_carterae.AAC.2
MIGPSEERCDRSSDHPPEQAHSPDAREREILVHAAYARACPVRTARPLWFGLCAVHFDAASVAARQYRARAQPARTRTEQRTAVVDTEQ